MLLTLLLFVGCTRPFDGGRVCCIEKADWTCAFSGMLLSTASLSFSFRSTSFLISTVEKFDGEWLVDDPGASEESAAFIRFPTLDPLRSESEVLLSLFASLSDRIRFAVTVAEFVISTNTETSFVSPDFSVDKYNCESPLSPISSRRRSIAAAAQYRILVRKDDLCEIKPLSLSALPISFAIPPSEGSPEDVDPDGCSGFAAEAPLLLLGDKDPFCLLLRFFATEREPSPITTRRDFGEASCTIA